MSQATLEQPATGKPKMVFRLKFGQHIGPDPKWKGYEKDPATGRNIIHNENGQAVLIPDHVYNANDTANNIIHSDMDLCERFGKERFERVPTSIEDGPAGTVNAGLLAEVERLKAQLAAAESKQSHLTTGGDEDLPNLRGNELKEMAQVEEVDISRIKGDDAIRKAITDARAQRRGKK